MSISLTITRDALSLPDLVITGDPTADYWIDVAEWPEFAYRYGYAPDSDYIPGRWLLSAVLDASELPATIYAKAATTEALEVLREALTAALAQWSYDVTVTIDGIAGTWPALISRPRWARTDWGMVNAHMDRATVTIPLNPGA